MWYDYFDNSKSLQTLYNEIPSLEGIEVRIGSIIIGDERNRVTICFDMPRYADFPPDRWSGSNTAVVEVDFYGIANLKISTTSNIYRGKIAIEKNTEGLLEIRIRGSINLDMVADSGYIQRISAYLLSKECYP